MPEWFETYFDGLYWEVLAALFEHETSRRHAEIVARLLALEVGDSVLDVPCGMGRVALALLRMGFRVTGVDLQARYVEAARRAAKRERLDAHFAVGDMREISFEAEFDGAFNWFTSFGYFSEKEDREFLKRVRAALVPGGRFAVDVVNKPWLLANFRETNADEVAGIAIEERRTWDAAASRIVAETIFSKGGRVERVNSSIRLYSAAELQDMLVRAGFAEVAFYSADGASAPAADSPRLVAAAKAVKGNATAQAGSPSRAGVL